MLHSKAHRVLRFQILGCHFFPFAEETCQPCFPYTGPSATRRTHHHPGLCHQTNLCPSRGMACCPGSHSQGQSPHWKPISPRTKSSTPSCFNHCRLPRKRCVLPLEAQEITVRQQPSSPARCPPRPGRPVKDQLHQPKLCRKRAWNINPNCNRWGFKWKIWEARLGTTQARVWEESTVFLILCVTHIYWSICLSSWALLEYRASVCDCRGPTPLPSLPAPAHHLHEVLTTPGL